MIPERHRDAKGRYTAEPNGPTAKVRALEAQVQALTTERDDKGAMLEEMRQEYDSLKTRYDLASAGSALMLWLVGTVAVALFGGAFYLVGRFQR